MTAQTTHAAPPAKSSLAPVAPQSWVDLVCTGSCSEFLKSYPTVHAWRAPIFIYIALFAIVILVLVYKAIVRRISASPEAPFAPKTIVVEEKTVIEKTVEIKVAPKSPRAKTVKKTAPVVVEPEPEPVVSPKVRRTRQSTSPKAVESAPEVVAEAPKYVYFEIYKSFVHEIHVID
jgi:outer membrane biosynthesis protein TonB